MRTNDLSSFRIWQVFHFPILSHGLSLKTISNILTWALQSVSRWKNIQCFQLKFSQCSQHKFYASVSWCFRYSAHRQHVHFPSLKYRTKTYTRPATKSFANVRSLGIWQETEIALTANLNSFRNSCWHSLWNLISYHVVSKLDAFSCNIICCS